MPIKFSHLLFSVLLFFTIVPSTLVGQTSRNSSNADRDPPIIVKVLVLCYDPSVPAEGNRKLWQIFKWNEPKKLVEICRTEINKYSHGRVAVEFVDWIDINDIPQRIDGNKYTPNRYVHNRRTKSGWMENGQEMDYYKVMRDQHVAGRINSGEIDEVWCIGDHYFGTWEAAMMGPGAFFINGGVYPDIDTDFPFAVMGGNYERNVDCMLENLLHRTENHVSRAYGGWNLKNPKTNWDRFTANIEQSPLTPAVGTCHYSPNSKSDCDWWNERYVDSTAEDWLNYPNLTGKTTRINCEAWRKTGWHQWWMAHLPKVPGVHPDGRQNNWWKYVYDFDNYEPNTGAAKPIRAACNPARLRFDPKRRKLRLYVAYSSPKFIKADSVKKARLYVDWKGTKAEAVLLKASDHRNDTRIVAEYAIPLPKEPTFTGKMILGIEANQVFDLDGAAVPGAELASAELEIENGKIYCNGPLDLNAMIQRKELHVDHYEPDIGNLQGLLMLNEDHVLRSRKSNPAMVTFHFSKPMVLTGLRFIHSHTDKGRFRIETANTASDLEIGEKSYRETLGWTDTIHAAGSNDENKVSFDGPVETRLMRLTVQRLSGDDHVHLSGLRLYFRQEIPKEYR